MGAWRCRTGLQLIFRLEPATCPGESGRIPTYDDEAIISFFAPEANIFASGKRSNAYTRHTAVGTFRNFVALLLLEAHQKRPVGGLRRHASAGESAVPNRKRPLLTIAAGQNAP